MISEEERELLKAEIREEMSKTYGAALAELQKFTRFRRRIEADGADLPKRKNVFLGTTMKLLGTGRIEDSEGSYWDTDGIVLVAAESETDVIRFERSGEDSYLTLGGYIGPASNGLFLKALSPDTLQNYQAGIVATNSLAGGGFGLSAGTFGIFVFFVTAEGNLTTTGFLGGRTLRLTDGIAAPSTVAGVAQIYVDSADGALKVKFGDGFVATLAAGS